MARSPRPLPAARAGVLALALALGACADDPAGPGAGARPNLLLVSIDTLRADHLSSYGYGRETSPTIDRLAAEGVRFERCLATTSWTLPSHLSMLTGLEVSAHGIDDDRLWTRTDAAGELVPPDLRGRFVSEALHDAGYATAGFYTWKYLDDRFGFGPGFDAWERLGHSFYSHPEVGPLWQAAVEAGDQDEMRRLFDAHPDLFDETRPSTPEVLARAEDWLDAHAARADDAPFFLFVHLFDVHDPYTPPAPYDRMFDPDYDGAIDGRRVTAPDSPVRPDMAARDLEHLVARYDGGIRYVDAQLARLLAKLDEHGWTEDTLVVVTSDHGEEFFEHGGKTHRASVFLESVSVPLVMRWPAGLPAGRVVPGDAGIVDVTPTLCAAAEVDLGARASGRELLSVARGDAPNEPRGYLSELILFDGEDPVPLRRLSVVDDGRQALYDTRGRAPWAIRELDLVADPLGRGAGVPLGPDGEPHAAWLEYLDRMRATLTRLRAGLPRRAGEMRALSPLERQELAAMGYGGAGDAEGDGAGAADPERLSLDGGVWPDGE